jgi:propanol-preferring alcohol dehydrogenase
VGLYGFGAAAHILTQIANDQGKNIYAFMKPGDIHDQAFARNLGGVWTGGSDDQPPKNWMHR